MVLPEVLLGVLLEVLLRLEVLRHLRRAEISWQASSPFLQEFCKRWIKMFLST